LAAFPSACRFVVGQPQRLDAPLTSSIAGGRLAAEVTCSLGLDTDVGVAGADNEVSLRLTVEAGWKLTLHKEDYGR
jgi:hypothetical protein